MGFLAPCPAGVSLVADASFKDAVAVEATQSRKLDLLIQANLDEVLAYKLLSRPRNTSKNYLPKQKEWKVKAVLHSSHDSKHVNFFL